MRLVVDANVVISAMVKRGVTFDVFLLNHVVGKFEFIAPEFLMVEVEKHREELLRETKLPENEFNEATEFLIGEIDLVPSSQFSDFLAKGKEASPHPKDFEYFALALKLGCPLFSGDPALKHQPPVKVLSPRELLDLLFE
jgi:predicted nucleic acid-binding protein